MWLLFTLLFVNYANCCQEDRFADKKATEYEVKLLLRHVNDIYRERYNNAFTKIRIKRLEEEVNYRLNSLLKGIAGALLEAQFTEEGS